MFHIFLLNLCYTEVKLFKISRYKGFLIKKDKRILESEKAIIEAGIEVLINNPHANMSEIAQRADIGRATLYRLFESREALIQKLALVCFEEIDKTIDPYTNLRGIKLLEKIIELVIPMSNRFKFMISLWVIAAEDKKVREIYEQQHKDMCWIIDDAKNRGEITKELSTLWLVNFFDGILDTAWGSIESGQIKQEDAIKFAKQSFFNGCCKS